jgi:hypothetical protein
VAWVARGKKNSERDKNREEEKKKKPLIRQTRGVAKNNCFLETLVLGRIDS